MNRMGTKILMGFAFLKWYNYNKCDCEDILKKKKKICDLIPYLKSMKQETSASTACGAYLIVNKSNWNRALEIHIHNSFMDLKEK